MKQAGTRRTATVQGGLSSSHMLGPGSPHSGPRTPSPSPASGRPREKGHRSLRQDLSEDSDGGSSADLHTDEQRSPGIRYITEGLLKKLSKQDNLALVQSLNLSLAKSGGKKFKFIENLEKCERLQVLNLSHNLIEKIEKLEKLHRLRELNLSHNRISKIEGLEHMVSLHHLNLSSNAIEHVPAWVGRKLQSLQTLHLKQNSISSLHEITKLKLLKNLTALTVAENPIANLPHCRLFVIFHLRALEQLDGRPVTEQERQQAHQRFHLEELERLEQELEGRQQEVTELREAQAAAREQLGQQELLSRGLQLQSREQKQSQAELERELHTKDELLKQKTVELTRACQKQYELEQELAFYKIDAKFEPLAYYPEEDLDVDSSPGESPYIGKARFKRNAFATETFIADRRQQARAGQVELDSGRGERPSLQDTLILQEHAEERLGHLQKEIENAEHQILRATEELKQLEEAVSQKRISEAEKEQLRLQLRRQIQLLGQLRQEAQLIEEQLERRRGEMSERRGELDQLQTLLDTLDPSDPHHAHVQAQMVSKGQQLDMMSRQYRELENRLDEMLTRIAKETEEIKDLEQQLTDGQIAANEALKRDLEGIIAGLQGYLDGVRGQASLAQEQCRELERERDALRRRLGDTEEQRRQLEIVAMDAENAREELAELRRTLEEVQAENASLREAQGHLSAYEGELEAQLRDRDTEARQLEEELGRVRHLSQMEKSALQAELEKERQAGENALAQAQLAAEREQENLELLHQLNELQEEKGSLTEKLQGLQGELDQARQTLLHPDAVLRRVAELQRKIATGLGEIRAHAEGDVVGGSLAQLQQELARVLARAEEGREEAVRRQGRLTQEMGALRERLRRAQEEYKAACDRAAEARVEGERQQAEAQVRRLQGELQRAEELQAVADQRRQEAEEERDRLAAELEARDAKVKEEQSETRKQLSGLDRELRELRRSMAAADKMAAQELTKAKDQLRSLHGTVRQLNQERAEEVDELEGSRAQADRAGRDLARAEAEIELLQRLLEDREQQVREQVDRTEAGVLASTNQQLELDRLARALERQRAQTSRLRDQLARAREENSGNLEELVQEIGALRDTLAQQSDFVSSLSDPFSRKGYWYYMPAAPNAPSVGSQSTHDSGLGSQYPASPERGRRPARPSRRRRGQTAAPAAGGYWIYSPLKSGTWKTRGCKDDPGDSGEESEGGSSVSGDQFTPPPGSAIYTVLPDGSPLPQGTVIYAPLASSTSVRPGTVIYGPPPAGIQLVYGPPPANFTVPLAPTGVLHCNVPEHHELEKELCRLEESVAEQRRQGDEARGLRAQCRDLEQELDELRRAVGRQRQHREILEGVGGSLVTELALERSLREQGDAREETECLERTLLRRRAELREADRLLAEAETELKDTRAKTRETVQRYSNARRRLEDTEWDAEELERRAQETATQLVQASQKLRDLQDNLKELEDHKAEQEAVLKEIQQVVSSRDSEFQVLNQKMATVAESLETLQAELQLAQSKEAQHLETMREAEGLLSQRRSELERLNSQVALQQEQLAVLDRKVGQRKEEQRLLQECVEQRQQGLADVLRGGEEDVRDLQRQLKELRANLEDLSAQKEDLGSQLSERRAQISLFKQEGQREEETLQNILSQINKHKAELKHVLEMIQLESSELQGVKLRHDHKLDELEKTQRSLLQVKVELESGLLDAQRQGAECERNRELLEQERQELDGLRQETESLRATVDTLAKERGLLEDQCQNLDGKLTQAERSLKITEESVRVSEAERSRLEAELAQMRQDLSQAKSLRQEMSRDVTATQQQLEESAEELKVVKDDLGDARQQLRMVEEDVRAATQRRDELLAEQSALKEALDRGAQRVQENQRREQRLDQELRDLQAEIEKHQARLEQQERSLRGQQEEAVESEEVRRSRLETLRRQLRAAEAALSERRGQLEQAAAGVSHMEEQGRRLRRDQEECAVLQDRLSRLRQELAEREKELQGRAEECAGLQRKLDECRREVEHLQETLRSERLRTDRKLAALRAQSEADRQQTQEALQEKARLERELVTAEQAAGENHQRARSLQKELNTVSRELLQIKDKLRTKEDMEARQQEIKGAMRSLRSEVRAEMTSGIGERDPSPRRRADTEHLKENDPHYPSTPGRPACSSKDEQWRGEALREKLRQREDLLKAQLRRRMWTQAEVLSLRRQQTEGSLQGLRRRVDALDELLGNSSSDSLSPINSEPPLKHGRTDLSRSIGSPCGRQPGTAARSNSPVRLDPTVPERDPGGSW
ncbi:centriolin isoform X3 [Lepisosteus oculatus]|uniref:centriolin isoform X3 n=1 Tax=Lepisosteus oculatus TaxID=7918 RepID=UPI0037131C36